MAPNQIGIVLAHMKTIHAVNFFLVGLIMCFSPAYWPNYFSGDAVQGNASELWLLVMGVMQAVIGAWTIGLNEVSRLVHFLSSWEPVRLEFVLPDVGWGLPESFYADLSDDDAVNVALTLQQQLRLGYA